MHPRSQPQPRTIAFWLMDAEMYTGMGDDGTPGTVVIERGMSLHRNLGSTVLGNLFVAMNGQTLFMNFGFLE